MKGEKLPSLMIMQNIDPNVSNIESAFRPSWFQTHCCKAVNIVLQEGGPCCIKWCAEHDRWLLEQVYLWWPRPLDWRNPLSSRVIGLWGNLTQRRLHIWEELRTDRLASLSLTFSLGAITFRSLPLHGPFIITHTHIMFLYTCTARLPNVPYQLTKFTSLAFANAECDIFQYDDVN